MYTTLIFDLDGTLTDSGLGIMRCAQFALSHFGIHVEDYTTLRNFVGPPLEDSFIDFYGFTPEQADEAVGIYRERYFTTGVYENEVYPGTVDALQELQRRGYRMGIGSSKNVPMVIEVLRYFNLAPYFEFIAARDPDGLLHSKADVLRYALEHFRLDPARATATTISKVPTPFIFLLQVSSGEATVPARKWNSTRPNISSIRGRSSSIFSDAGGSLSRTLSCVFVGAAFVRARANLI